MPEALDPRLARQIIETVGSHGTPPEWGFQYFSAGLKPYLDIVETDYLDGFIADGGAAFKMPIGSYGGGKTHFLYSVRELAWKHAYAVSYVSLSAQESPFHELHKVVRAVMQNLMYPMQAEELLSGYEKGIGPFLKVQLQQLLDRLPEGVDRVEAVEETAAAATADLPNPDFGRAVRLALRALVTDDPETFERMVAWLLAGPYDRRLYRPHEILQGIDRSNAFATLRSLVRWATQIGYRGLVLLLDEAEAVPSLSSRQRDLLLSNLRELIDACGQATFRHVMIFYAVPDERFFSGGSGTYEALQQRIASIFDFVNPSGVKIRLDALSPEPEDLLLEIGLRLREVYEVAYRTRLSAAVAEPAVRLVAQAAYEQHFGDIGYKRLFVQGLVRALHALRRTPRLHADLDWAREMIDGGGA